MGLIFYGGERVLDRIVGGVGLRRGRRDPKHLRMAMAWISGALKRLKRKVLRLYAEMILPAKLGLSFESNLKMERCVLRKKQHFHHVDLAASFIGI